MREVISINIGQTGIQMSNANWELFCVEHGIEANGKLKLNLIEDDSEAFKTFFEELPDRHQYVPRNISIDLEATVIDEVRKGSYRNLFHPDYMINALADGANNFARGLFTIGKTKIKETREALRRCSESCDMLQGFFIGHSCGGGTGSGFSVLLLENLGLDYAKRTKIQMHINQSPILTSAVIEPYNAIMALSRALEGCELSNLMDNEAMYNICTQSLEITRPTFNQINRLVARLFSDMTVSMRFESSLNSDLDQICTNLIPFPRIHYPIASFAPINSKNRAVHELWTTNQLTRDSFEQSNRFATCDPPKGRYMCCVLQYRGDISRQEVNSAILDMKKRRDVRFVNWVPTSFKIGINCQPPTSISTMIAPSLRSAMMLSNNTAVKDCLRATNKRFDILFSKRSFIHWYVGEGMEEGEFNEARDDLDGIIKDYDEIEQTEEEFDLEEEEKEKEKQEAAGGAPGQKQKPPSKKSVPAAQDEPDDGGGNDMPPDAGMDAAADPSGQVEDTGGVEPQSDYGADMMDDFGNV